MATGSYLLCVLGSDLRYSFPRLLRGLGDRDVHLPLSLRVRVEAHAALPDRVLNGLCHLLVKEGHRRTQGTATRHDSSPTAAGSCSSTTATNNGTRPLQQHRYTNTTQQHHRKQHKHDNTTAVFTRTQYHQQYLQHHSNNTNNNNEEPDDVSSNTGPLAQRPRENILRSTLPVRYKAVILHVPLSTAQW